VTDPERALHVVVAGGGVAGLELLVALRALAGDRVRTTLVEPGDEFHLHALDAGEPFGLRRARRYAIADIAAGVRADLVRDAVDRVAAGDHAVHLRGGGTLGYDVLVLALGATPYRALGYGLLHDPVRGGAALRRMRTELESEPGSHVAVVVPRAVGWTLPAYELALMLSGLRATRVSLVTAEREPLEAFGPPASAMVRDELALDGVELVTGEEATADLPGRLTLGGGRTLEADRLVHLPLLAGPALAGVPCDADGFILTGPGEAVEGRPDVFAAGDGVAGGLKQGGLAAQRSEALAVAIARRAGASVREPEGGPVLRAVLNTRRGPRYLRAEPHGGEGEVTVSREALWWPPTKVWSTWLTPWLATHGEPSALGGGAEPAASG
jgi:sulfide:quinone oxidoreductase